MSVILGINCFHAGASAALIIDGIPVAAIAEERLNRKKYYGAFPTLAIRKCLEMAGLTYKDIDAVAVGRDSKANVRKKIEYVIKNPTNLLNFAKIRASRSAIDDMRTLLIKECDWDPAQARFQVYHVEHHLAHIASAYYISPWEKAAGFSVDGSGDFVTAMFGNCEGPNIDIVHRIFIPHSLGNIYFMVCQFVGYNKYGDEGKLMGLAPYGTDTYREVFDKMVTLTDDGLKLNPEFFRPLGSDGGLVISPEGEMLTSRQYSDKMCELFGAPRQPDTEITQRDMDLAFGVQHLFEKVYMHLLQRLHRRVPTDKLVISGGCALNSVANGKIFEQTPFRETCIQPAAGDEGLALGAALYVSNAILGKSKRFQMKHSYTGPSYSESQIKAALDSAAAKYIKCTREELLDKVTDSMMNGNITGWFQGQMEWGPRALGNRSIIAHPGISNMKDILNARIKRREWFRPFAPSVKAEAQSEIFERSEPSPFMLHVYKIKPEWRKKLCAVNHIDDTGRLQTVTRDQNELYYDLIGAFEKKSGIPVVLNTSFNENEPIVCQPPEAIECFLRTKMDALAIGNYFCKKGS